MTLEERPVFRFISPRGPAPGMTVDPSQDVSGLAVLKLLEGLSFDPAKPTAEVLRRIAGQPTLTRADLDASALAEIYAAAHDERSLAALWAVTIDGVQLPDVAGTRRFTDAYRAVTDSWLTLRLHGDRGVGRHEQLIRAANLSQRLRSSAGELAEPGTIGMLWQAHVVFPKAWLPGWRRHETVLSAHFARLQPLPASSVLSQLLARHRRSYEQLTGRIALRESLQRKAERLHTAWQHEHLTGTASIAAASDSRGGGLFSRPGNVPLTVVSAALKPLDQSFYTQLDASLTAAERTELGQVLTALPRRPDTFGDLLDAIDVGPVVSDANRLCALVQSTQDELSGVPEVTTPQPGGGPRPAVRAIGWGDLVVARERLVGYDASEIAHIENVLSGESKVRQHERTRTTEQMTETETREETESERDQQTTDRYELQNETQRTIEQDFSIEAGVNTSGRYGMTRVETSLEVGFQQSKSEARNSSVTLAKDVVSRAVERTFEAVRELRRLTLTEQIRELNHHGLSNVATSGQPPPSFSGIYLWLEKIHEVELRHYGTRLMVEFHIPEPAIALLQHSDPREGALASVPAFRLGPSDVTPANYLCLIRRYGADDIDPPPPLYVQIGWAWASVPNEEEEANSAEDVVADTITIPDHYRPVSGSAKISAHPAHPRFSDVYLAIGGRTVLTAVGIAYDEDVFSFDPRETWPVGVPVTIRAHGHFDKTLAVHTTLRCERTPEALTAWQLRTWERLRAAHQILVRDYERAQEEQRMTQTSMLFAVQGRPETQKREVEREEIKKWSIKIMRWRPFDFDAVARVGDHDEIDPLDADFQAPIVRFFEEAFEWEQMSYFLQPYFWGRRDAWRARMSITDPDPRHAAFLRAGSARVIVPVTPGYEGRVLQFLESDPDENELDRVTAGEPEQAPSNSEFTDLWLELLLNRKDDVAFGSGTLSVQNGSASVSINDDSTWLAAKRDLGRELYIAGDRYEVSKIAGQRTFDLDRPFAGTNDAQARFATGTVPFGPPWLVRIPTSLVILNEERAKLPTFG